MSEVIGPQSAKARRVKVPSEFWGLTNPSAPPMLRSPRCIWLWDSAGSALGTCLAAVVALGVAAAVWVLVAVAVVLLAGVADFGAGVVAASAAAATQVVNTSIHAMRFMRSSRVRWGRTARGRAGRRGAPSLSGTAGSHLRVAAQGFGDPLIRFG